MTLSEIVCKRNNIRVKEYEHCGDGLIFVGGCFITGGMIIPLDGNAYTFDIPVEAWEWQDNTTLMIMR